MPVKGKAGPIPGDRKKKAIGGETEVQLEFTGGEIDERGRGGAEREQVSALFEEAKLLRDKEGHQLLRADFVVVVSESNVKLLPKGIRAEWDGMKAERLLTEVSLDGKKLPVQVVQARMWPDRPEMKLFEAVGRLERVKLRAITEKNSSWIELRVSITRGKDADLWDWLSDNYPCQSVWLKFADAQGELLERFLDDEASG